MVDLSPPVTDDFLAEKWEAYAYDPELVSLRERLLVHGGEEVVPISEPDATQLLREGSVLNPTDVIHWKMADSRCHANSAVLFQDDESPSVTGIGMGWALSSDGLWRQHSWAHRGDEIVETTMKREKYFGVILKGEEAEAFASMQL